MSLTAEDIRNCTMIALDQPPWWPVGPVEGFRFTIYLEEENFTYTTPIISLAGTVIWGDGQSEATESVRRSLTHTYASKGRYQVVLVGILTCFHALNNQEIISVDTPFPESMSTAGIIDKFRMNLGDIFSGCHNLETIPASLFDNCAYLTRLDGCFNACYKLKAIPDNIFVPLVNATTFDHCFSNCRALTSIPDYLFALCENTTTFEDCFQGCWSINSIGQHIFYGCESVETFKECFLGCHGIHSIPSGLFSRCTSAMDFSGCFADCVYLSVIGDSIFPSGATDFSECFNGCDDLHAISNTFRFPSSAVNFHACFSGSGLQSISGSMFYGCTAAEDFSGCFSGCQELTIIDHDIFAGLTGALDFSECFYHCNNLTIINANVFDGCTSAVDFTDCFAGNSQLFEVHGAVFNDCSSAEIFDGCFSGTRIYVLDSNIFSGCTGVKSFKYSFAGIIGTINSSGSAYCLSHIFDDCLDAEDFGHCFEGSYIAGVDPDLFLHCISANDFTRCFYGCGYIDFYLEYPHYGVPRLWESHPGAEHSNCFSGCYSAINYNDIPEDWGGPEQEIEE